MHAKASTLSFGRVSERTKGRGISRESAMESCRKKAVLRRKTREEEDRIWLVPCNKWQVASHMYLTRMPAAMDNLSSLCSGPQLSGVVGASYDTMLSLLESDDMTLHGTLGIFIIYDFYHRSLEQMLLAGNPTHMYIYIYKQRKRLNWGPSLFKQWTIKLGFFSIYTNFFSLQSVFLKPICCSVSFLQLRDAASGLQ